MLKIFVDWICWSWLNIIQKVTHRRARLPSKKDPALGSNMDQTYHYNECNVDFQDEHIGLCS